MITRLYGTFVYKSETLTVNITTGRVAEDFVFNEHIYFKCLFELPIQCLVIYFVIKCAKYALYNTKYIFVRSL